MSLSILASRLMQLNVPRVSLMALLLAGSLLVVGVRHAPPVAHASGGCVSSMLQIATPANSASDWTRLDYGCLNNLPNWLLIVTHNITPWGAPPVFDNHPLGVFYAAPYWYIFHQDRTPIPNGDAFNVQWTIANDYRGSGDLVQTATSANSSYDYTIMNESSLNNQPSMRLLVTSNWNPGGAVGVYNNHPIGVFYAPALGRWCIFNQDGAPIPAGASFNVMFWPEESNSTVWLQTATTSNRFGATTVIDNAQFLNNDPSQLVFVTPDWNPGGVGGVYENHNIGVYYDGTNWRIFNEDGVLMPLGAAFSYI